MRSRAAQRLGIVALLAGAALLPMTATAQPRPSTLGLTCGQATALVRRAGAIVLGTGGQTYDRFVASRRFCEVTEVARAAFAPTRDTPSCPVGYRCVEPSRTDFFWD